MILEKGEKIHIVERRFFAEDVRRHFCGVVIDFTEQIIRAAGYVWVFDMRTNHFVRKPDKRERLFCLAGDRLTINILPPAVDINSIQYVYDDKQGHRLTDGKGFSINFNEFGAIS